VRTLATELRPIAVEVASGPRVYVDANMPRGLVTLMRGDLRWDVVFVLEDAGLRRAADYRHYDCARDLGRTLITLDHDFLDEKRFPSSRSPGVVVCSAPDERGLCRLLQYLDRAGFRAPDADSRPLLGRKLELTPAVLSIVPSHDANPDRRRRRRASRPGRVGTDARPRR
jgi:uncharacterized protein DUF5615